MGYTATLGPIGPWHTPLTVHVRGLEPKGNQFHVAARLQPILIENLSMCHSVTNHNNLT